MGGRQAPELRRPALSCSTLSEALTKGPFNMLLPVVDLNSALLGYIMGGYQGFSTAAGYIGPNYRVDHDISLVVPEIWSRMFLRERDPKWLIEQGYLEAMQDFEDNGETIPGSRLGYRITFKFVDTFFGRMFTEPRSVFTDEMLRPELQNHAEFVDGIKNITETQQKVAKSYFDDGGIEDAIPPLKALLHIMAHGDYEGKSIHDPEVRALFDRETVIQSEWYKERLVAKREAKLNMLRSHVSSLESFIGRRNYEKESARLGLPERLEKTKAKLSEIESDPEGFVSGLVGTIGTDPSVLPS